MGVRNRPALPLAEARCAPLLREPITASQAAGLARLLEALADQPSGEDAVLTGGLGLATELTRGYHRAEPPGRRGAPRPGTLSGRRAILGDAVLDLAEVWEARA